MVMQTGVEKDFVNEDYISPIRVTLQIVICFLQEALIIGLKLCLLALIGPTMKHEFQKEKVWNSYYCLHTMSTSYIKI
ncbi:hypothetical protein evm_000120 [Chilo suppressalis]|nr:hypothetical protein evm_000120 [Chilo suppressalis]